MATRHEPREEEGMLDGITIRAKIISALVAAGIGSGLALSPGYTALTLGGLVAAALGTLGAVKLYRYLRNAGVPEREARRIVANPAYAARATIVPHTTIEMTQPRGRPRVVIPAQRTRPRSPDPPPPYFASDRIHNLRAQPSTLRFEPMLVRPHARTPRAGRSV